MTERKAFFAGSFDPLTKGHLSTIERAAQLFDHVYVGIVTNTNKKSLFTSEERLQLAEQVTAALENVTVVAQPGGLTIDVAQEYGANFLIRGIRNQVDYEYERQIAYMNRQMTGQLETVFLLSDEAYSQISSSMVKEIAAFQGDVSPFVPEIIARAIEEKVKEG